MSGEDLRAILGLREESFAAELTAHRLDEVSERRVLGRARRARGMRVGVSAVAAAVVAALFGVGVWALVGENDRDPLITPPTPTAVTVSASPTPTATPSPSPAIVFSEPLPADEFFLEAKQLTEDIWQSADDGWSLTSWQPARQSSALDGQESTDPGIAAIYLMDNNGNRYEVSHFELPAHASIELVAWEPTEFTATVMYYAERRSEGGAWDPELAVLDIRTGDITLSDVVASHATFIGVNSDSNLLFRPGGASQDVTVLTRSLEVVGILAGRGYDRLSPDGTTLVHVTTSDSGGQPLSLEAYSATTGSELWSQDVSAVTSGLQCDSYGWITRDAPALVCSEYGADSGGGTVVRTTFFAVDHDGVSAVVERLEDLSWGRPYPLPTGIVDCGGETFGGNTVCTLYFIEGTSLVPVPTPTGSEAGYSFTESGDVVALKEMGDVSNVPSSVTATRYDSGATFTITPRQHDDPTWLWTTVSGVVVAGSLGPAF